MLHPFSVALSHFTIKQTPTRSSVSRPNVPFSRKSSLTSLGRIVFSCLCAPKTPRSYNNWAVISCLHVSLSHQTASGPGLYLMHFHVLHWFFLTCSLGKCFMREWMYEWMNESLYLWTQISYNDSLVSLSPSISTSLFHLFNLFHNHLLSTYYKPDSLFEEKATQTKHHLTPPEEQTEVGETDAITSGKLTAI